MIFITAYPERFLTGERPEPAFLIAKPFQPATVSAVASQALFFEWYGEVPHIARYADLVAARSARLHRHPDLTAEAADRVRLTSGDGSPHQCELPSPRQRPA